MIKPPLILLVDDETHVVNVLSLKLRSAGFRVHCATDGREAINCAQEEAPDLVITDYRMPLLDGRALSELLLLDERTQHVPVIMLTGLSHNIPDGNVENIKATICKPFSPREVLDKVNALLNIEPDVEDTKAS